ncbi:tRNA methyltransferase 10 homolog A [Periplaneta americana]|uniref:tRNA methyltransferase 10 homolog A n=1 Tax=Periplaneta americana TaxID=6978 RepID=UPI0037E90A30
MSSDGRSLTHKTGISTEPEPVVDNEEEPAEKRMKLEHVENDKQTNGENETICSTENEETEASTLSKRQLKKLRKKEKWLAYKPLKRAKEKERLKEKKLQARLNNVKLGPSRKELKHSKMSQSNCTVRVAIDLSFDELMNGKEIGKCIKQLLRCYSLNRRAKNPMQFYVTSFNGKSKEEMEKHSGYMNWDVNFLSESYSDVFESKDVVYLTSESDNVISTLEGDKVYIIGGLVDHNSHKGLCHRLAQEKGVSHGQLPIGEFLEMKSRKVLTIDHVFEILLAVTAGQSWKEAFLQVLPSRKGAVEKTGGDEDDAVEQCDSKDTSTNSDT